MSNKKNLQYLARRKLFRFHQYWNINYTEKYGNGTEKDFKTFIKSKSYEFAKEILLKRLREDDPDIKIKAVHGFMFHRNYKATDKSVLKIEDWEQIRKASFPNEHNVLFKYETVRKKGKSNRFNETDYDHLKGIGFKSGSENWSSIHRKGKTLPIGKRSKMIFKGKWIPWDKACRNNTKQEIISALIKKGNNRSSAAIYLNISRHKLYALMSRFPEIDWDGKFPAIAPFSTVVKTVPREVRSKIQKKVMKKRMDAGHVPFQLTPKQAKNMEEGKKRYFEKMSEKRKARHLHQSEMIKKALLDNDNHRRKAAESLGWNSNYMSKIMQQTKHTVDWNHDFPNINIAKKYL
jgi:transcriptional regulator with GAF, ATPase, and Fis domain